MKKTKINNINTEITRVEPGQYVFNHEMARITEILYNAANDNWQITTPGKHILGDLNHQKMVDILMGHCGFEADSSRVLAAALTLELANIDHETKLALGRIRGIVEAHEGKGYDSIVEAVSELKSENMGLAEVRRALEGKDAVGNNELALGIQKLLRERNRLTDQLSEAEKEREQYKARLEIAGEKESAVSTVTEPTDAQKEE